MKRRISGFTEAKAIKRVAPARRRPAWTPRGGNVSPAHTVAARKPTAARGSGWVEIFESAMAALWGGEQKGVVENTSIEY